MKETGIVRHVDKLGRIVLPKELRSVMDIALQDPIEFYEEEGAIILHKYNPNCIFCGEMRNDYIDYKGLRVCSRCLNEIRKK